MANSPRQILVDLAEGISFNVQRQIKLLRREKKYG